MIADIPPIGPLVLIVDDDPDIRELTAAVLEGEGYATLTAPNGAAALTLLVARHEAGHPPPAAILLDMRMPVMDGWQFARAYREALPFSRARAPIICFTAASSAHARAQEISAEEYLAKPFGLEDLFTVVTRCVARRRDPGRGSGASGAPALVQAPALLGGAA